MARANCAVLLWLLVAMSVKLGRPHIAHNAVELMERCLAKDDFPEYYDGKTGRYIGKQSRKFQPWLVAGYLVAKMLLDDPSNLRVVSLEDDGHTRAASKVSICCTIADDVCLRLLLCSM